MRKIESLFIGGALFLVVVFAGGAIFSQMSAVRKTATVEFPDTQFGAFLAAQHAIYVNDFENAARFADVLTDKEIVLVQNTKYLSDFLNGKMPSDVDFLKKEQGAAAKIIYDAHLVQTDQWKAFHNRHKKDTGALSAPFRIWSAIANDWRTNTFKFIDGLSTSSSWKSFVRGQIYVELGDIDKANIEFANVHPDFMNINDYLYLMSFYNNFGLYEDARILHDDFVARPGGMFMAGFDAYPAWETFSGYKNQLAFSLVQTVSHTQILMYSDLAMLFLRFAQITAPEFTQNNDAVNYYLGQYFYTNRGNYQKYFDKIPSDSPFKLFADLRDAERSGDVEKLSTVLESNPLFVPAINTVVANNIKLGNRRAALRVVDRALSVPELPDHGRAFLLKSRAHINYMFGKMDDAQSDLHEASNILTADADILSLQAKIWAAQNREIENAYDYAMSLVKMNPSDVFAWDTLACVVNVREGEAAALEILERVGEVSTTCSSLFERIGDLYHRIGDKERARQSYKRAIELSDDGFVVVPNIEKKLRKIK